MAGGALDATTGRNIPSAFTLFLPDPSFTASASWVEALRKGTPMRSFRPHRRRPLALPGARHSGWLCVLCVLLVAGPWSVLQSRADASVPAARMQASFFDSVEARTDNITAFHKWRDALQRSAIETAATVDGGCDGGAFVDCPYRDWLRFLERLRGRDRWQQLLAVNLEINKRRYVGDPSNYGLEDYWASAGEFLSRRSGDCEDYAIAKYLSLRRLGWGDGELRLAAVKDLQLHIGHAVLIAFHGGTAWLLDNQIREVVDAREVHHYQPLYSINEGAWWRHQPRGWSDADGSPIASNEQPASR